MAEFESFTVNFGPQHPAAHGVLRLVLEMDGEVILKADPHIGLLHRATEKLAESKPWNQTIGYTDRLDYVSMMCNEHSYVLAIEKLLGVVPPIRAQYIRVMFDEITRILNHLMWLGSHGLDIGAMTVFLYCFREREYLLDVFEMCSGQRMMTSYFRPGGVWRDVPEEFEPAVRQFIDFFPARIADYEALLTHNPIWLERTKDVGVVSAEDALAWGLTGPSLRASGVEWDIRKAMPYSGYEQYEFDVPVKTEGDVYARYLCRMEEMRQSLRVVEQALDNLPDGPFLTDNRKVVPPPRSELGRSMEAVIHHFKLWTEGFSAPEGYVYQTIESPRGELGCYLRGDGSPKAARVHFRAPSYVNLASLPHMAKDALVADLVAIIGSIDIVLGEIDR
jgi:NADH-quinone oxidoreductase subunit D